MPPLAPRQQDAKPPTSHPEQEEVIPSPRPNTPSPIQLTAPTTDQPVDPSSSLTLKFIMDFFKSLEGWGNLKRMGLQAGLSLYKIPLDLDKLRKAFIAANFTEEEFTLFKTTTEFQDVLSIYTKYNKGMLTKEQAIAQLKDFIPRIQPYINKENFRPYYTKLTGKP
ncbi:MAG: hypothetical protein NTX49_05795 [Chlamydiae bacterium]|nr:hypothetical protein [Chlamydiota bacterium]